MEAGALNLLQAKLKNNLVLLLVCFLLRLCQFKKSRNLIVSRSERNFLM